MSDSWRCGLSQKLRRTFGRVTITARIQQKYCSKILLKFLVRTPTVQNFRSQRRILAWTSLSQVPLASGIGLTSTLEGDCQCKQKAGFAHHIAALKPQFSVGDKAVRIHAWGEQVMSRNAFLRCRQAIVLFSFHFVVPYTPLQARVAIGWHRPWTWGHHRKTGRSCPTVIWPLKRIIDQVNELV